MPDRRKPLFVKPVDLGTMVCGSADTGHPVSNLNRHDAIGLTWKATDDSAIWVRGEFDDEQTVDFCAIVAANAQSGTQVRLRLGASEADVDGGSAPYDSGAVDFIATTPRVTPDDGLYHSHLELNAGVAATWWRIDISSHTGSFEAADVVMGQAIEPSHFYNLDYEQGDQDLGDVQFGRYGVLDEQPGLIWRTLDFALGWQSETEYETSFRPLTRALGKRNPVFIAFDPADTQDRQVRTYMGFLTKPAVAKGIRKVSTYAQEFSILSFI